MFLCEAAVLERDRTETTPHMSAEQAGKLATEAGLKRLLLTHFLPEYRLNDILTEAQKEFKGILELAEEKKVYCI